MTRHLTFAVALLLVSSAFLPVRGQVMVFGDGDAHSCFKSAESGDNGRAFAVQTCRRALAGPLNRKDEAATYINLGILLMRRGDYDEALAAYDNALAIRPDQSEAYINKGACLIYMGDYQAAVDALTRSIDLGTDRLAVAHYNRALAYEKLEDYDAAYADLQKALSLRPGWVKPQQTLQKYKVIRGEEGE